MEREGRLEERLEALFDYIREKKNKLDQIRKELAQDLDTKQKNLKQCKYNRHHYIPQDSLDSHESICPYMALGMTKEDIKSFNEVSTNTPGPLITITPPISLAIRQYVDGKKREETGHMTAHMRRNEEHTLESSETNNEILESSDPILIIRYIKSWSLIPHPFCQLVSSSIHPVSLKSWLFKNLPEHHAFRHEVGGALHIVDVILHHFNLTPTVNPDLLINRLQPFLFSASRGFVLSLWKFLSMLRIQQEHNITDTTVNEILPLPGGDKSIETSLVSQINTLANQHSLNSNTPSSQQLLLPIPIEYTNSTVDEKRTLYDYCIELNKEQSRKDFLNDQSLFRDDSKILSGQGKVKREEDEKSHLEHLKDKRDVRRRRQSYRAKNVHITQKSIKQMFREIIAARTEELQLAYEESESADINDSQGTKFIVERNEGSNDQESDRKRQTTTSKRSRSRERRRRSPSYEERSRKRRHKRSRSRERSHDRYSKDERRKHSHKSHKKRRHDD